MNDQQLTDGSPVPADRSHTEINPATGMQKGYVVLSGEERAKGFVKPLRHSYRHGKCGGVTTMGNALAETYARNPSFYSGTFCAVCRGHFPLTQFTWDPDGEPMLPALQPAWKEQNDLALAAHRAARIDRLRRQIESWSKELSELELGV